MLIYMLVGSLEVLAFILGFTNEYLIVRLQCSLCVIVHIMMISYAHG